jgi:hypothetical protein
VAGCWGFATDEWSEARRELESMLVDAARSRSTITYGEVARRALRGRVSARSGAVTALLGEVDSAYDERLGIMLASLVVRADTGMPGEGYFSFAAHDLGRREALDDPAAFWRTEAERVWDAFAQGRS